MINKTLRRMIDSGFHAPPSKKLKPGKVLVWVTRKSGKFRALIQPLKGPAFEITVGGKSWLENDKGITFAQKEAVLVKLALLLRRLQDQFTDAVVEL